MSKYLKQAANSQIQGGAYKKKTPQSKPIPGREKSMLANNAGGFAFKADSFTRLNRFLILGSESGSYYVGEKELTTQNLDNVRACIAHDGLKTVQAIVGISEAGRAAKNDPALYALALAASYGGDLKVREAALAALPRVARIGTHLFQFCGFIDTMRGWGPALRRAVANWYLDKEPDSLAYQLCKYQYRDGWSHRDVIRLAHPNTGTRWGLRNLLRWTMKGSDKAILHSNMPMITQAAYWAKSADEKNLVRLIVDHRLTHEMIPTEHLKSPAVWEALLERMPPTAMIRSLGRMSSIGLLSPLSYSSGLVCDRLVDAELLHKARVHPIQVLSALLTYGQGRGQKGSLTWKVDKCITAALDAAFYKTFAFVEPTNKRFILGIDVSGSMTQGVVAGIEGLSPNMGAAAMAMLIARTEPKHFIGGFSTHFVPLDVSPADSLRTAMSHCQRNFGGTDTTVAIDYAIRNKILTDVFIIITDGETWAGNYHTCLALNHYRRMTGLDTKVIVINMVANKTSIIDPTDAGSLDIVGFDASVPALINEFIGAGKGSLESE